MSIPTCENCHHWWGRKFRHVDGRGECNKRFLASPSSTCCPTCGGVPSARVKTSPNETCPKHQYMKPSFPCSDSNEVCTKG